MRQIIRSCILTVVLICLFQISVSATEPIQPKQYRATDTSASIRWKAVPGADHYTVVIGVRGSAASEHTQDRVTQPRYTVSGLLQGEIYDFCVVAFNRKGNAITGIPTYYITVMAKPAPVRQCSAYQWDKTGASFNTVTGTKNISGLEWRIESLSGKRLKGGVSRVSTFHANIARTGVYVLKVRPYIFNSSMEKKIRGKWKSSIVVPEPEFSVRLADGKNGVTVSWKKINGANQYAVYGSEDGGKTYRRLTTTNNSTSCTIKQMTGPFVKGKIYYFKVYAYRNNAKSIQKKSIQIPFP